MVFQKKDETMFAKLSSSVPQLSTDRSAKRRLVLEPPEIESAHAIGLERLGHLNAFFQDLGLLLVGEVGVELVAFWG